MSGKCWLAAWAPISWLGRTTDGSFVGASWPSAGSATLNIINGNLEKDARFRDFLIRDMFGPTSCRLPCWSVSTKGTQWRASVLLRSSRSATTLVVWFPKSNINLYGQLFSSPFPSTLCWLLYGISRTWKLSQKQGMHFNMFHFYGSDWFLNTVASRWFQTTLVLQGVL